MVKVGLDIGSTATKCALRYGARFVCSVTPTGWAPAESAEKAMREVFSSANITNPEDVYVTVTGYGRNIFGANRRVTEITCHAAGAHYLAPEATTVLDIGGQDSKVIKINRNGKVLDFLMNDKCAAGTGRFLQNMAAHLGCTLEDFRAIPEGTELRPINSMCTVFAESEVVGLLAKGVDKNSICLGLLNSVADRAVSLLSRLPDDGVVCFTGGCARNEVLSAMIERKTGRRVITPEKAQFAGAIGATMLEKR